jgi:leucyl aminopeptidase (aminopeptidase T)
MNLTTMTKEAELVVDTCLGVKQGEKVTIAMDSARRIEAEILASVCHARGAEILVVDITPYVIPISKGRYVDPPENFKTLMKNSNLTMIVTSQEYSQRFSHKIHYFLNQTPDCSVYQIDEEMGAWDYSLQDVNGIMAKGRKIMDFMKGKKSVRVTSPNGTDISFSIENRECMPGLPVMPRPGMQAACPIPLWGELNWAPVENRSCGHAVIDGILMRWGSESAVTQPVQWEVKDGRIVEIRGGEEATQFRKTLESADANAYIIGELGIGASHKAKLGTMQEKGRIGTVHLGVGSNKGVYPGGTNVSKIHGDGSIRNVSIEVDGTKIIEGEKILL